MLFATSDLTTTGQASNKVVFVEQLFIAEGAMSTRYLPRLSHSHSARRVWRSQAEQELLLFCPRQGGWRVG